jgi:hypothetical protein
VKKFKISSDDIKFYFKQNKTFYIAFVFCFFLGVLLGIFFVVSNDGYLSLATSKNKVLFEFVNGTVNISEIFGNKLSSFICPMLFIFLLNLNFYVGIMSYIFVCYQSILFVMSMASIVSLYGFSGILNVLFVMLPINLIYFVLLSFFLVQCLSRSYEALKNKKFTYGFCQDFYLKIGASFVAVFLLVAIFVIIYSVFLKNSIFIIF